MGRKRASSTRGMRRSQLLAMAVAVVGLTVLAGCGGDDEGTAGGGTTAAATDTTGGTTDVGTQATGNGPACDAVAEINRLDDEIEAKVREAVAPLAAGAPDAAGLDKIVESLKSAIGDIEADAPKLYGAYDRIKEQSPDNVDTDIDSVKDVTAELLVALKKIQKPADLTTFTQGLQENPRIQAGVQATLRLDEWVRDTCGVGITN